MNWIREPEAPKAPIRYFERGAEWAPGSWPINFTWDKDWSHATYQNEIDDGSDDNEVIDIMHQAQMKMRK